MLILYEEIIAGFETEPRATPARGFERYDSISLMSDAPVG